METKIEDGSTTQRRNKTNGEASPAVLNIPVVQREEREYIDRWALDRLPNSRGKVELLMVYVRNEENRGHNFDTPSVFERDFAEYCNRLV